ncbi:MAG: HEAT repeat domain-containing protein [Planctomycetes bacterium]|nr:HEAT repeat domain-containing protein [Planctomycetota bacterium]
MTDRNLKLDLLRSASKVNNDDWTLQQVIMELGLLGSPEAGEVLIQIMKSDRKDWMKEQAAGWLGNTGGPGALEALLEAYHSNSFYLQVVAAGSLYKQGYPGPVTEMLPKVGIMIENPDGSVRADAAEQLQHLAFPEALPLLTRALQDSNGDVRIQAIRVLRQGTIPGAEPLLEKMLADPNPQVVKEAQRALTSLRDSPKKDPK